MPKCGLSQSVNTVWVWYSSTMGNLNDWCLFWPPRRLPVIEFTAKGKSCRWTQQSGQMGQLTVFYLKTSTWPTHLVHQWNNVSLRSVSHSSPILSHLEILHNKSILVNSGKKLQVLVYIKTVDKTAQQHKVHILEKLSCLIPIFLE